MKIPLLKITLFITFIASGLLINTQAMAADTDIEYEIEYAIIDHTKVVVTYKTKLTQNKPDTNITGFSLTVPEKDVTELGIKSTRGLTIKPTSTDTGTVIQVTFPTYQVLNTGQSTEFSISYVTGDVIQKRGEVTDLIIAGFNENESVKSIKSVVIAPKSMGIINYISSNNYIKNEVDDSIQFIFDSVPKAGINISFGNYQNYEFNFNYTIENRLGNTSQIASITIPFNSPSQNLIVKQVSPNPYSSYKDYDGNFILEYLVKPGQSMNVIINGYVKVNNEKSPKTELAQEAINIYTRQIGQFSFDKNKLDSVIVDKIDSQGTNDQKAKVIYDFVLNKLTYSTEELNNSNRERIGAQGAFDNPDKAICQEYADLFVGISRAFGIPARVIAGYAYPTAGYDLPPNILHAWAQYYSESNGWVNVDPTWQDTSGDFNYFGNIGLNHLPIAIYGENPDKPVLVLSFVPEETPENNFVIEPISDQEMEIVEMSGNSIISINMPSTALSGIDTKALVQIYNNYDVTLEQINLYLEGKSINLSNEHKDIIILPKTYLEFPLIVKENNWLFNGTRQFKFKMSAIKGNEEVVIENNYELEMKSPFTSAPVYWMIVIVFSIGIGATVLPDMINKTLRATKKRISS